MSDERADAIIPTAAALVCAVADRDRNEIANILATESLDWQALCVVLAANVPEDVTLGDRPPFALRQQVTLALRLASDAFDTTPEAIRSSARHRNTTDARSVVMAALRWSGHSASWIGRELGKDHTSVLYAVGRVGEDPRLKHAAQRIVLRITGGRIQIDEQEVA